MAEQLCFSERQATAILEMRLYKLIGLEIEALMKEHEETLANIVAYEDILNNRSSMAKVIIKELKAFQKAYATERKTKIDNLKEAVVVEKKIEEQDVVFLMDRFGYAKTIDPSIYERNKETADTENRYVFTCKNTDKIAVFTNKGQLHLIKVMDLPYGKFRDKGTPIDNISNYDSKEESFIYVAGLEELSKHKLIFGTKTGMLKLVEGETIVMRSSKDMFLRVDCQTIPEKKKGAVGVRGMKLDAKDYLTHIYFLEEGDNQSVEVKGKEVVLNRLHVGNRDTKGVRK